MPVFQALPPRLVAAMEMSEYGQRFTAASRTVLHPSLRSNEMSDRSSKQVVQDAWRAFASRDPLRIAAAFTEQAQWLAPEGNATALALNYTNHMVGREAIVRFLTEEFPKLFVSDVSVEFKGMYVDADTVIVEERMRATLSNGRSYDNDYCFFFTLSGDRISFVREYMDTQRGAKCIFG
jgi:uncharacterized protein